MRDYELGYIAGYKDGLYKLMPEFDSVPIPKINPEWISIEKRFPADMQEVIVYQDFGNHCDMAVVQWDREIKRFHVMNGVTHWLPLPNPPIDTDSKV